MARTCLSLSLLAALALLTGCAQHPLQPYLDDLHQRFVPQSDIEAYGRFDYWVINDTGDCEDFALLAQAELGRGHIRLTRTPKGQLHAVLELEDGYLLDILHPFPVTREQVGYTYWVRDPVPPNDIEDLRNTPEHLLISRRHRVVW